MYDIQHIQCVCIATRGAMDGVDYKLFILRSKKAP